MSQWYQTVGQQQERELREEYEQALLAERANRAIDEHAAMSKDEEFRQELEARFPYLKGWK